jgi:hypothetical protein
VNHCAWHGHYLLNPSTQRWHSLPLLSISFARRNHAHMLHCKRLEKCDSSTCLEKETTGHWYWQIAVMHIRPANISAYLYVICVNIWYLLLISCWKMEYFLFYKVGPLGRTSLCKGWNGLFLFFK